MTHPTDAAIAQALRLALADSMEGGKTASPAYVALSAVFNSARELETEKGGLADAALDRQMQNAVARHDALPDYLKATPPAQAAEAVERVRCALWENRTGTYDAMARAAIAAVQEGSRDGRR